MSVETPMRLIPTLIAACVIAASPVMGASAAEAAADWREYVYPEDGFAIQFPAEPSMSSAPFETIVAIGVSANVYSLTFENILFEAKVVELDGLEGRGANFVNEVAYRLQRAGNVTFHDFPRVDNRQDATFGHTMVIDTGDGRRIRSSSYFANGRFYEIVATVLPERGDLDQVFPSRFDQTIRFNITAP
jgi:hypothetical protein